MRRTAAAMMLTLTSMALPPVASAAPAPLGAVQPGGELRRRALLSFQRLDTAYPLEKVFRPQSSWPGDHEGRALLGLTLIAQATGRTPRHLEAIVAALPGRLNARGYLGPVAAPGTFDEQALSGHSWLLRGLAEYHAWKKDAISRAALESVVRGLLLPTRGHYARYPVSAAERPAFDTPEHAVVRDSVAGWKLSSDVGCAFIMLDGATHAYEVLKLPELAALIEEMIARFRALDVIAVNAQTHATLSATRGILRWARLTGRKDLVALAVATFDTYRTAGMTENHENVNWFGRPKWTEGCAVIDSFDAALALWRATGQTGYLEDAQNVYYNGMAYNQRPNGGFGCNRCVGADGGLVLAPFDKIYEATGCCTMRGGEGMARAVSHGYDVDGDTVTLPVFHPGKAALTTASGKVRLTQTTAYPLEGKVMLEVDADAAVTLRLFVPSWVDPARVTLTQDGARNDAAVAGGFVVVPVAAGRRSRITLAFPIGVREAPAVHAPATPGARSFRHGPLLLGTTAGGTPVRVPRNARFVRAGRAVYRGIDARVTLRPIGEVTFLPAARARADRRQVLFAE